MFVCCDNYLLKAAKTEVRSNLINEHPQSMLSTTFGYCVVSNGVCYLGQSGSAGVSDFIPCHTVKDFCKASSIPPSCPPNTKSKPFVRKRGIQTQGHTDMGTDSQVRRAQTRTRSGQTGRQSTHAEGHRESKPGFILG